MKGPGLRLELDVRRLWECRECGRQVRGRGETTARLCRCTEAGAWMRLIEQRPRVRPPLLRTTLPIEPPLSEEIEAASDIPEPVPEPEPVSEPVVQELEAPASEAPQSEAPAWEAPKPSPADAPASPGGRNRRRKNRGARNKRSA